MTDAEIVARAIWDHAFPDDPIGPGRVYDVVAEQAAAVVAALTEAGRLRGVDRAVRDAIEHLLLFVEQGEHGWTIEGKAETVRAWLDVEPTL